MDPWGKFGPPGPQNAKPSFQSTWVAPPTPNFTVTPNIQGGGNSSKTWNAGGTVGVEKKISDSFSVGASVTQHYGRQDGHSYKTSPTFGIGFTKRF